MNIKQPLKIDSVIKFKGLNWFVRDWCKSCKLVWLYRIEWKPYKTKNGSKPIPIYKKIHYNDAEFICE